MESSILFMDNITAGRFNFGGSIKDLCIDKIINEIVSIHESEEIREFFRMQAKDHDEVIFRQDVFKDLADPEIREAAVNFLKRFKTHRVYLSNAGSVSQKQSSLKWHLDAAYYYCCAVSGLDRELDGICYISQGLERFHKAVRNYRNTEEYLLLEKDTYACHSLVSSVRYQLELDLSQYRISVCEDTETGDFCDELSKTFEKYHSSSFDMQITALPGINMGDLELLILSFLMQDYPNVLNAVDRIVSQIEKSGSDEGSSELTEDLKIWLLFMLVRQSSFIANSELSEALWL
jgi:stalled ribosome rescue protein Dom34